MAENAVKQAPRIRRRETWVPLPGEYDGFEVRVWVNAPSRLWNQLTEGDEQDALDALQEIVLEHNGWLDFEGEPYPPASDPAFWEAIPTELAAVVLAAAQQEIQRLPNSMRPRRGNSRRG